MLREPGTRALQIANAALAILAAFSLFQALFAARAHRGAAFVVVPILIAIAVAAALRLSPARRVIAAAGAALIAVAALGLEVKLGRATPRDGSLAASRGVAFDTRSVWDVIHDERGSGGDAYPSIEPRALVTRRGGGVEIDGVQVLPLGGIAGKKTVLCNEGGAYAIYESDERGFNNPKGIWGGGHGGVEVGIVGEAFMQGACAPPGRGAADEIRQAYLATINLGVWGNGPLIDLAGIMEYFTDLRPKVVVWSYYHNDLVALESEKQSPILRRYLDADGTYRQGLSFRQSAIDEALTAITKQEERDAPVWPGALAAIGLSRQRTPMWLEDLITGDQHSTAGSALRFDRLSGFVGARLGPKKAEAPPDLGTFKRILEKAKATVSSWGGKLYFVYLADLHHLRGPEHPTRQVVLETARAVGLPIIDVQPVFAAVSDPMTLRYNAESHLNEEGHRLVGQTIVAALRRAQ